MHLLPLKINKKGFTIVELVIVIAVIAILAAVLIPTFSNVVEKANKSSAMQAARNEYELYLAEHAEDLKGTENYLIKSKDYYFVVNAGQFDANAIKAADKPAEYNEKVDLTKDVYTAVAKAEGWTAENGKTIVTTNDGTDTAATVGTAGNYFYKTAKEIGSADVAIYAKAN